MIYSPERGGYGIPEDKEIEPSISVINVENINELNKVLLTNDTAEQGLGDEEVQGNLSNLIERVKDMQKELFVMDNGDGKWAVVASSEQEIQQIKGKIQELSTLQASIDGETLWGMCIYVHDFASASGIADGSMCATTGQGDLEKSIYPIRGIHEIGYVNMPEKQMTVYFDLTAKPYVFTPGGRPVDEAVMQGVIVVEQKGQTSAIESLYQTEWRMDPFKPEQSARDRVLEQGNKKFKRKQVS